MTDAELDALAREILTYCIHVVSGWDTEFFHEVLRLPDGELIPVYGATDKEQIGHVLCEFAPLAMIKKTIVESERILDEFVESLDTHPLSEHNKRVLRESYAQDRDRTIKLMARSAALHLIAFFHVRLAEMLGEAIEDCKIVAESYLTGSFAISLESYAPEPIKIDARKGIEDAAERVAAKKREFLRDAIEGLPITTKTRRGAPPKSASAREEEREAFSARIEATYRKLRSETGKSPSKRQVAKELRIGGISPHTGTDSRLSSLNVKLRRLGIDYKAIAAKVDAEGEQ